MMARHHTIGVLVQDCLRDLGAAGEVEARCVASRDNSLVFRATVRGQSIAVKFCREPHSDVPDLLGAAREFDALQRLHEATQAAAQEQITPTPLKLVREQALYAMSWCEGISLTDALLRSGEESARLGSRAGQWLRRFHALHPLSPRRTELESKVGFLRELADRGWDRDRLFAFAARRLERAAPRAEFVSLPSSWIHGDFKSDNILVGGRQVYGLDAQLLDENTVAHDLAPFLVHLRLLRWTPRGFRRRQRLAMAAAAVLTEYSDASHRWTPVIEWLQAYQLICRLEPSTSAGSIVRRVATCPLRSELRDLCRSLDVP